MLEFLNSTCGHIAGGFSRVMRFPTDAAADKIHTVVPTALRHLEDI